MRRIALVVGVAVLAAVALLATRGEHEPGAAPGPATPAARTDEPAIDRAPADVELVAPARAEGDGRREGMVSGPLAGEAAADLEREGVIVLAGRVFDLPVGGDRTARRPAAGVLVEADRLFVGGGAGGARDETDDEGRFRLEVRDDGERPLSLRLSAESGPGQRAAFQHVRLEEGRRSSGGLELYRHAFGVVHGVTVDPVGAPVPGVEVRLPQEPGDPVAVSDDDGRFRFEVASATSLTSASKDGWRLVDLDVPRQLDDGSWAPARLLLARSGALRVVVRTAHDDPVAGRIVVVDLSPSEPLAAGDTLRAEGIRIEPVRTGPDGTAWVPEVWADQRLRVLVSGLVQQLEYAERIGSIVRAVDPSVARASPIVVPAGGVLELHVELPAVFRVSGRAQLEDGADATGAVVVGQPLLADPARLTFPTERVDVDLEGRFELQVLLPRDAERVRIRAGDPIGALRPERSTEMAVVELPVSESPVEGLVLTLREALAIRGRLETPEGASLAGSVHVRPAGATSFGRWLPTGAWSTADTTRDGSWSLSGLQAGRYDLEARAVGREPALLRDVEAGRDDVVVVLEPAPVVRVVVEVECEAELDKVFVLHGTWRPPDGFDEGALPVLTSGVLDAPSGWPSDTGPLWHSDGETRTSFGARTRFVVAPVADVPHTLELEGVPVWIGVRARTAGGGHTYPIGTGLVRTTPGEHRLVFRLPLGSPVEGRVLGIPEGSGLCVAVVGADGEPFLLGSRRDTLEPFAELGALGTFVLPLVPAGEHELWVGTQAELEGGRPRLREPFEARDGTPVRLELELGR